MTLKEREREKEERNKRVTGKLHTLKGERELDNGKNHGYGKREGRTMRKCYKGEKREWEKVRLRYRLRGGGREIDK